MRALVLREPYLLECCDVPVPDCDDDDVLIRVGACGICGSDVQGYTGKTGRRIPPVIMGHEAAGTIEQVGRNVTSLTPGDRVCFDSTVYCNRCAACRAHQYNRCAERQVLGVSVPEFKRDGAMAEFVAVPHWIVSRLPNDMSLVQAAMLEPTSIGVHAVNRSSVSEGDTVVVIGAGTIGLSILQAAGLRGAQTMIACDMNDFRLDLARQVGADVCVNPRDDDLAEIVKQLTDGHGANVSFEAVGLAETFGQAVAVTAMGGCIVAVGNVHKHVTFNLQELVARELTFAGSYASAGEFAQCIELIASGRIRVEPLISEVLPLAAGPDAFERLLKGQENLLKIILEP